MQRSRKAQLGAAPALYVVLAAGAVDAQTFTKMWNFGGSEGAHPGYGSLLQGPDGNLYGTTVSGGASGQGVVYRITTAGALTAMHSFQGSDGSGPCSGLAQDIQGNLYGTTQGGGRHNAGTIFKMTLGGSLTTLHSFGTTDGSQPCATLMEAINHAFYGSTTAGGANGYGTIFKITMNGTFTSLHSFNSSDGSEPFGTLAQGGDGDLYGTTYLGGPGSAGTFGTVFKITLAGVLTSLSPFGKPYDPANPMAGLLQTLDGSFMGASVWGGSGIDGTVFSVTRNGAVSTVYSFNGSSGANPDGPLISGTDGNYYGTASGGGSSGLGTIYQVTSSGVTVLYVFSSADQYAGGSSPTGGLLQATNGNFYGTASGGGTQNLGTVYRLSMGLGPFVTPVPGFGRVGDTVQVLGTSLSGATSVTFNGVPATITAAGATEITVTVPSGATSGPLQVAKPAGTLTSNVSFSVRQ